MKRLSVLRLSVQVMVLLVTTTWAGTVYAGGNVTETDADVPAAQAGFTTDYIMIKFNDPPAASYEGGVPGYASSKPLRGKFDPNSRASQAYLRYLSNVHANYRRWLKRNARGVEIVRDYKVTFNGIAVKLNKVPASRAGGGPGVKAWAYSTLYYPSMNVSTTLIGADVLWGASRTNAGSGIEVAIIDSGIQGDHPFFACKTITHHGPYASGVAPFGPLNPLPTIINTHGTHVAGTVGGCVCELITCDPDGGPITNTISGVAPGATLHDFNVFPGVGAGLVAFGGSAFSHDIANAIEDAVSIGVDVINMSLGGGVGGPHDFLAEASDAAVDAGVVVVAAAGNSGPGDSTVESPGSGRKVIAAGMTTNPHFIGIPVNMGTLTFGAALGDFSNFAGVVTADYTVTTPTNGCTTITNDLTGMIALIDRGVCTFTTKVRNAQARGAIGVLVVNNLPGDPFAMAHDGTSPFPTIPAALLSKADGNALKPSGMATVDGDTLAEFVTTNSDIIDRDSSRGPTPFTFLIKPDVTAPGVNVYSSVFSFGTSFSDLVFDFELFSGTSMATPHVAGSAALLIEAHPDWSPADVRSALVNTAKRPVFSHTNETFAADVLTRGGGRIDLPAATATPLTFDPATASFGFWGGNKVVSGILDLKVHNVSGSGQSCTNTVTGPAIGPAIVTAPSTLTLAVGETKTLRLTLNAGQSNLTPSGDYSGDVVVTCGATTNRVPWFVRIDREGKP